MPKRRLQDPETERDSGGRKPPPPPVPNGDSTPDPRDDNPHSPDDDQSVGYGRPPPDGRFKPGESGNYKGRPKHSRNLKTLIKRVVERDMEIREGGRLRRMPAMEVLLRTLFNDALKGNPKAVASLMILLRQSGYIAEQDEATSDPLAASKYDQIVADFLAANGLPGAASMSKPESPDGTAPKKKPEE